jgi:hypothetical protein
MYELIHTVFPALFFQPIAGHVSMRYPDLEEKVKEVVKANNEDLLGRFIETIYRVL